MTNINWKKYWNTQQDPRHSVNKEAFFQKISKEMAFHLGDIENKNILEIGCGDGSLLKFLPIKNDQYIGIDFSNSLLELFKKNHPDYKTLNTGGIEYLKNTHEKYDIIFSYGLLQYFDKIQLKEFFLLQSNCLRPNGFAIHFGVPILEKKNLFTSGKGIQNKTMFKKRILAKRLKSKFSNNIGHWHKLESLCDLSLQCDLTPNVFGGIHYLYRINLLQKSELTSSHKSIE